MRIALVLSTLVAVGLCATWPCTFTDTDGNFYDFTSVNTNKSDTKGQWMQIDAKGQNWYFWKLCDPTTDTPSGFTSCAQDTQVCQQPGTPPDKSCGIGPPSISYVANAGGVIMSTQGGYPGCSPQVARSVQLNLLCASANGKADSTVDIVQESSSGCQYTIKQYFTSACGKKASPPTPSKAPPPPPTPTPPPSPTPPPTPRTQNQGLSGGSVFLIIFFVSLFVYFAAGIGYNYYNGSQGAELIPQVEFWKDLPFLVKDGVMFCVGLCTGGGGYNSV